MPQKAASQKRKLPPLTSIQRQVLAYVMNSIAFRKRTESRSRNRARHSDPGDPRKWHLPFRPPVSVRP